MACKSARVRSRATVSPASFSLRTTSDTVTAPATLGSISTVRRSPAKEKPKASTSGFPSAPATSNPMLKGKPACPAATVTVPPPSRTSGTSPHSLSTMSDGPVPPAGSAALSLALSATVVAFITPSP